MPGGAAPARPTARRNLLPRRPGKRSATGQFQVKKLLLEPAVNRVVIACPPLRPLGHLPIRQQGGIQLRP